MRRRTLLLTAPDELRSFDEASERIDAVAGKRRTALASPPLAFTFLVTADESV